ncbi:MAG: ATP-dependent zinc metalloprotease FtsH [Planctomycetaceae bacterium]|nr:ATP-dependent zinc metalloprotease FtsH [Planctomycetaceae bacterium]
MSQNEHDTDTERLPIEPEESTEASPFQQEVQRLIKQRKATKKSTAEKSTTKKSTTNATKKAPLPKSKSDETPAPVPPLTDQEDTDQEDDVPLSVNKNDPNQKPQPKPPDSLVSSLALVALIVASSVLFLSLFAIPAGRDIPFDKMMELIDKGPGERNFILVTEGMSPNESIVRYSNLERLVIDKDEIRGLATRQVMQTAKSSEPQPPREKFPIVCGRRGFAEDGRKLQERLEDSQFTYRSPSRPHFFQEHGIWIIMFACFLGLTFFLIRGLGNSGAMAFSKNRGRLVAQEEIDINFDNVAGVDEAVEELKEIVEFLQTPEKFHALGGRIPRGVLLVGPPGTGKTILAKAVAGEAHVPFYSLSGSDFVELYVGVGAARVRDLFEQAQRRNPCIIFIDELDALGKVRSGGAVGGHDERDQTLNALLVEMDGFSTGAGIIVMGATNRPEILDPALLRPGRFDRQVLVDRPDLVGREAILKVHAKNVKLDETIDLKQIASITSGFVGADLAALVNEAALLAARSGKTTVTMTEFTEGVERVTIGLQKKQRVIRPDEKRRIAIHECGHALVAYFTPHSDPVHKVSIIPRGLAALGYTSQRPEDDRYLLTKNELEARIQTFLGGTIAEEMEFDAVSTGAQNDLERATDLARGMVMDFGMSRLGRMSFRDNPRANFLGNGMPMPRLHSEETAREIDQEIKSIIDDLFQKTQVLLEDKKEILERLTERLLEKEIIETEELKEVIEEVSEPIA